jgi:hypothetical protein
MEYHPHVHLLVTAGGLSSDGAAWVKPAHTRFLRPGYMLSELFRAKSRDELTRADVGRDVNPAVWERAWVVHVQQIGRGDHAALYLSRYIYKVALTNDRIERVENERVTFRYVRARTGETRRQTLPVDAFIGRFLQHVLPPGFTKVRSYGLLSPSHREKLERARHLLQLHAPLHAHGTTPPSTASDITVGGSLDATMTEPGSVQWCSACHRGTLHLIGSLPRPRAPP